MSARIGEKRLQKLVDATWAMYPGGEIPQVHVTRYSWGKSISVRLYTSENLVIGAEAGKSGVHVQVYRRNTILAWANEKYSEEKLWETAKAFERAAYLVGLATAERG